LVSDFYTPNFFDPAAATGVRYSFSGKITRPRQILDNGYISWVDPSMNVMRQLRRFGPPEIVTLPGDPSASSRRSLRGHVDGNTKPPSSLSSADRSSAAGGYREARRAWLQSASLAHGRSYRTIAAER
jgi:hypothetical protein